MRTLPHRRVVTPAVLIIACGFFYLTRLDKAPRFVSHDEAVYSLQAHALAATGRDLQGRYLPLYIEYPPQFGRPTWDQPMLIYAIAATLKVLPFSEFSVRLPMAIAALVDVLLMYFAARALFQSELLAVTASLLLAATPAHFTHSRLAIDFQLAVPFVLGWLLCLLVYLRSPKRRLLFVAGSILGVGVYSYVIGYLLVPLLAAWTCVVLYSRRDSFDRYGYFLLGAAIPSIVCLPWLLRYPLPFRDVFAHYASLDDTTSTGLMGLLAGPGGSGRFSSLPALYLSFLDPRFLFVDGPVRFRSTHQLAFFQTAIAGLLCVGLARAVRRRSIEDVTLLAGLLTAPLLASAGGEGQAIWRALQMTPFAILIATSGVQLLLSDHQTIGGRIAALTATGVVIALTIAYHDALPYAQGLMRAATVPLAVAALAVLLRAFVLRRADLGRALIIAAIVVIAAHAMYFVAPVPMIASVSLLVAGGAIVLTGPSKRVEMRPFITVALVALMTSTFMYVYVDYGQLHRFGPVPASLVILSARLIAASLAIAVVLAVIELTRRLDVDGLIGWRPATLAALGILSAELGYLWIDRFTDFRWRAIYTAGVLALAVGSAMFLRARPRLNAGWMAAVGLAGIAAFQFGFVSVDYFTESQVRGSADEEGNAQIPFEAVIDRTAGQPAPAIYLGQIGPYGSGALYWKFYLAKHGREDLLQRTVADEALKLDRVQELPPGSLVITSHNGAGGTAFDELVSRQKVKTPELFRAPNGAPIFWVLETAAP